MNRALLTLGLAVALTACGDTTTPAPEREVSAVAAGSGPGAETFAKVCSTCHAVDGGGKAAVGAPALANLQPWYIERQLANFRAGIRGAHPEDAEGMMMAVNAKPLSDEQITALAAHIDTLPNAAPPTTLEGDLARGKDHYQNVCAACHGNDGLGNVALNAPALAGVDDWYLHRAYEKFRGEIRGAHPDDQYGAQMVRMAPVLADRALSRDVIAYVATLPIAD